MRIQAKVCNSLGSLYLSMGYHKASEEYYLRCLWILQNILPEDHPELATSLIKLYDSMGRYEKVKEYRLRLQRIIR